MISIPHGRIQGITSNDLPPARLVCRVGFWAALLAIVLNIAFNIALIAFPGAEWRGMYEFSTHFKVVDLLPALPSLLLAPVMVVLFAAMHAFAFHERKIASQVALVFAVIYAVFSGGNYFVQLTVVRHQLLTGETAGLAPFVMANPDSVALAIDTFGYAFLFLATLCAALVFQAGRIENTIRWLLLGTGAIGLAGVIGYMLDSQAIYFAGLMLSGVLFLPATALLAALFRRADYGAQMPDFS